MAIIDPHTRMNPAAQSFHASALEHIKRINDPALAIAVNTQGSPYITHHEVAVSWPKGDGIHHQREAMLEVLSACTSAKSIHTLIDIYNYGYYAGRNDESISGY